MAEPQVGLALIVEDDARLRRTLETVLATHAREVRSCGTVADAREILASYRPDLAIVDVKLPDGDALGLFRDEHAWPMPTVIAISALATPTEAFELAALGVRAYLQKPFDLAELESALVEALQVPPDVVRAVRGSVGRVGLHDLEDRVRNTMIEEAVERSGGNRRGAARLLHVSRQLLQHMLRARTR